MKICKNCGRENFDINQKCEKCGYPLYTNNNEKLNVKQQESGLAVAARVFMIIATVARGLLFLGLLLFWFISLLIPEVDKKEISLFFVFAWIIPSWFSFAISFGFSIAYRRKLFDGKKVSILFKVCVLIFISLTAGILLFIDDGKTKEIVVEPNIQAQVDDDITKLERYKDLLDKGVITQEEFDIKKKELLNL